MTVTGFNPHKVQAELLQSIVGGKEKYHIASIGRQFGKSMMGMNLALYWGFNENGMKGLDLVCWYSKIKSQEVYLIVPSLNRLEGMSQCRRPTIPFRWEITKRVC